MLRLGYCANSVKDINDSWPTEMVQITLNSRISPAKRDYPALLKGCKRKVILHYDYINTITRYAYLRHDLSCAVIQEIKGILEDDNTNILGVVMHTDYPFRKQFYLEGKGLESYNKTFFNFPKVESAFRTFKEGKIEPVELSVLEFFKDLKEVCPNPKRKIYLENTTKVYRGGTGEYVPGSWEWLICLMTLFGFDYDIKKYFGLCLDTEHYYAVEGKFPDLAREVERCKSLGIDLMVHLNTVPSEVKEAVNGGKLYKDLHSETLFSDCSVNDMGYYNNVCPEILKGIPTVREIKTSYMDIEINNIKDSTGWK